MTIASRLAVFAILCAGFPALAQQNDWDITNVDVSKLPPAASQQGVTYDKDVQALFKASCLRCHGEQRPRGGLHLDSLEGVLKGGRDAKVVIPGDSTKSLLVAAASRIDDKIAMPPKRRPRAGGGGGGPPGAGGPPGGGGPGGPGGGGPPPTPLTAEQVGLLRAWIDQGAK